MDPFNQLDSPLSKICTKRSFKNFLHNLFQLFKCKLNDIFVLNRLSKTFFIVGCLCGSVSYNEYYNFKN